MSHHRFFISVILLFGLLPLAHASRSLHYNVSYSGTLYAEIGMSLVISNVSEVNQTVEIDGGMFPVLTTVTGTDTTNMTPFYTDLHLTGGQQMSGWFLRGVTGPSTNADIQTHGSGASYAATILDIKYNLIPGQPTIQFNPTLCDLCPAGTATGTLMKRSAGPLGGGIGTSNGFDGPRVYLKPHATMMVQSERYGAGAHGFFNVWIKVTQDTGAIMATGAMYQRPYDPCGCTLFIDTTQEVSINGGRPF